jgi:ketosteroid isomerase-like protein
MTSEVGGIGRRTFRRPANRPIAMLPGGIDDREIEMSIPHHQSTDAIEHVFRAWDEALGAKDLDAAMALYHEDATLESPLVRRLLGTEQGIVQGRGNLREFVAKVFANEPPERRRFRGGFLSDGARVTWEYPRASDAGQQMDIVEVMEVRDGLIRHHRVYWGWYSVRLYEELERSGRAVDA